MSNTVPYTWTEVTHRVAACSPDPDHTVCLAKLHFSHPAVCPVHFWTVADIGTMVSSSILPCRPMLVADVRKHYCHLLASSRDRGQRTRHAWDGVPRDSGSEFWLVWSVRRAAGSHHREERAILPGKRGVLSHSPWSEAKDRWYWRPLWDTIVLKVIQKPLKHCSAPFQSMNRH